jgi:hypothetical protein
VTRHKVVLVPFPFDDLAATKVRPAVWDFTSYEPLKVRVGVGQSSSKVKAVLNTR